MKNVLNDKVTEVLTAIVSARYEDITTLNQRFSDDLDFHEVSVWGLKEILEKAYLAGYEAGAKAASKK